MASNLKTGHSGEEPTDLILRDLLAIDRTILANERTLLAYIRTVLALLAAGGTVLYLIEAWWALPAGIILLAGAPLALAIGVWRFSRVARDLRRIRHGSVNDPRAADGFSTGRAR